DPSVQPLRVQAALRAYEAAALRNPEAMHREGLALLASLDDDAPPTLREQALVIAVLGAIAEGDLAKAEAMEREYGRQAPPTPHYGFVRAYLLAWIDVQRQKRRQQGQGG